MTEVINKPKSKKYTAYILLTMSLTGIATVLVFIFAHRFLGGKYAFLLGDQDIQFALVDRMFWRHLLNGEGLSFSFNYSMGLPTSALYAVLEMSPFGILHSVIPNAEWAAVIIYVLKLMCAAAAFWLFSVKVLNAGEKHAVLLGAIYALSSYTVHFYMNIHFIDVVYITPLLILALIRFVNTGKKVWLILMYAFGFVNIFLTGYGLGIFSFVVFLALLIVKGIKGKELGKCIGGYVLSVLSALLISMIVILPAVLFFLNHMPEGSTFSETARMHFWEFFIAFLPARKALVFNTLPALYCGIPVLLLTVMFFFNRDISGKKRIAAFIPLAFLLLSSFWHPMYLLMHGFDEPDSFAFRFSYLWIFYLLALSIYELMLVIKMNQAKKAGIVFGLVAVLYLVIFLVLQFTDIPSERPSGIQWGISFVLLFVYFVLLLMFKQKEGGKESAKQALGILLCFVWFVEITVSGTMSLQNYKMETDTERNSLESRKQSEQYLKEKYEKIEGMEDDLFYRVDLPAEYYANESMELNMHGMGYFSSIENNALRKELFSLGYQGRPQFVPGRGSTEFTRMIFDNKYTIERNWAIKGKEQYTALMYPETLPIAFTVSEDITLYKAEGDNPFENQNRLASAMLGEETEIFFNQKLDGTFSGIAFYPEEDRNYLVMEEDSEGFGIAEFTTNPSNGGMTYVYFSQDDVYPEQYKGASFMPAEYGSGWAGVGYALYIPGIVPMGETEEGYRVATLVLQRNPGSAVSYQNAYCVETNEENLYDFYDRMVPGKITLTYFSDMKIEGTIHVEENMPVLYTSIPYDKGWHVLVDGKEAKTFAVMDDTFLAVNLSPGNHKVTFAYKTPGKIAGIICSITGCLLFCFFIFMERKKKSECTDISTT